MRWFLGLALATTTAHADPDWARCADDAMAAAPESERDGIQIYLHGRSAANFDGWEERDIIDSRRTMYTMASASHISPR